ncbi:hypothetical protein L3Y34_008030 [Caenorhabditis briggsae]|uniref:Serpentine receptor class gamma n=1 Tax=Caenorhabditis briggsae TaxID=6238 RepID=A0AAE9A472_CAEBR|nr:hypothetical protein L3Y34_008030 [Caenorhabditis briggsae]
MAFVQYSTTTVVALNRMTIILNAEYFEKRWRRYSTVVMSIVLIGPLLVTYDVFLNEAFYKYNFSANSYYLQSESSSFALFSKLFIFMCVCSPITFIANIVTFVKFHLLPFKPRNLEVQFCFVSLVSSIVQISGTLLTLAMRNATPGTELFKFTNLALPFVSDALSLIQPYALLLFSEPYAITTIISINRLTILWDHLRFEPWWRNYSFLLIFVVYFSPFISTGKLFFSDCTFGNRSDGTFVLSCDLPTSILFTPLIAFQIVCTCCAFACNITSLVLLLRASKELKSKMG